jgi:hypothetical protein
LHITSTKTPSHTHTIWLNSLSPQLPHLISNTEPMKYGEINTRINSLAGPTNILTHSPTSLNNLEEKLVSLTALPGLLPSPYSDVDPCLHKSSPTTSIDDTLHQTTACTYTEAFRRLNGETSHAPTQPLRIQELQTYLSSREMKVIF